MALFGSAQSIPGREFYRPSGGVNAGLFLFWWAMALAAAAILAAVLFLLFLKGFYFMILVPGAAALGVGAIVRMAVTKGHCRNWFLTVFAGILAAVVLYLGYFYCGMFYHWGPRVASHPRYLPIYIKARMKTDVIHETGHNDRQEKPDSGGNWYFFIFESGVVLLAAVFPGMQRLRRPYCEACGKWMSRDVTTFNPGMAEAVMSGLRAGSTDALTALCATPAYWHVPNLSVGIDTCPSMQGGGSQCPVYISVKQVTQSTGAVSVDPIDQAQGKLLLRTMLASSGEIVALSPRFQVLGKLTGRAASASGPAYKV